MAEKMGVNFDEMFSVSSIMEMAEDFSFDFSAPSVHFCAFAMCSLCVR